MSASVREPAESLTAGACFALSCTRIFPLLSPCAFLATHSYTPMSERTIALIRSFITLLFSVLGTLMTVESYLEFETMIWAPFTLDQNVRGGGYPCVSQQRSQRNGSHIHRRRMNAINAPLKCNPG